MIFHTIDHTTVPGNRYTGSPTDTGTSTDTGTGTGILVPGSGTCGRSYG